MRWLRDRVAGRGRRHDETGQALVEFALVLPLVILLMSVAFNGWNGIQLDVRLTSAARAGALQAANALATNPTQVAAAWGLATNAVNLEENSTIYQNTDSSLPDYVNLTQTQSPVAHGPGEPAITVNVVTITISQASVALVPVIGKISVSAHAAAEYS